MMSPYELLDWFEAEILKLADMGAEGEWIDFNDLYMLLDKLKTKKEE